MIGGDGLARGALLTLQGDLATACTALNADPAAPVQLAVPDPTRIVLYGKGVTPDIAVYGVAIEVSSPGQKGEVTDISDQHADVTAPVFVVVWAQDINRVALVDKLNRYVSAVLAVMVHHDSVCPGSVVLGYDSAVRAARIDPDAADAAQVQGWATVVLRVGYVESLAV